MSNYKTPPAYLRRALGSMLGQTMTDFEAVIINDGVKDESYEVLLEYAAKDDRIVLIENERNLGLPASLNSGLEVCRGKYIARMDTDDICLPERLALQVEYMESNPDIMFAGAWADVFEKDENVITDRWQYVMCSREEYRIRLLFGCAPLIIHPTAIFRASFLFDNGIRYSEDTAYRYSEDYELWTRCADAGKPGILQKVVLKYRNENSGQRITSSRAEDMERCVRNVQEKLLMRLGIGISDEDYQLHHRLLSGRKPYDLRYKAWINKIIRQNRKLNVYDQNLLCRILHDRWYNIVYYGTAYEKDPKKRLCYILSMYPDGYRPFIKSRMKKRQKE
ncbi:MAG: glycosyltransferase [Clostridia bacterium]|nr:glycosyltransferase [Clostridia bacterium]